MPRRGSAAHQTEETPLDKFISLFRAFSTRSSAYFWCCNFENEDKNGLHVLFGLQPNQMRKILATFKFSGANGTVSLSGSSHLVSLIGPDYCQGSKLRQRQTATAKSRMLYFVGLGTGGLISKVDKMYEGRSLIMLPEPPRLLIEERVLLQAVLDHCHANETQEFDVKDDEVEASMKKNPGVDNYQLGH